MVLKTKQFSKAFSVLRVLRPSIFLRMVSLPNHALRGVVFAFLFRLRPSRVSADVVLNVFGSGVNYQYPTMTTD